jgi:YbbR domain-containing protein
VKANIVGEPAEGYRIDYDNIFIDPTAALVKGPQSVLIETEVILTDPIDVVGRVRSFRIRVPLKASTQYDVESKELIDVMVPIKQEGVERLIESVPINVLHASTKNFSVTIDPARIDLTLKGPRGILSKLEKKNLIAYVNVSELPRGEYQLPLMLTVPSEISLVGDVPIIKVVIEDAREKLPVVPTIPPEITPQEEKK